MDSNQYRSHIGAHRNQHNSVSYDEPNERPVPHSYANSAQKSMDSAQSYDISVQKGTESAEPRLSRPDRVVYNERSEIPTETFVREGQNQTNNYGIDARRDTSDSMADSLLDQEESRNRSPISREDSIKRTDSFPRQEETRTEVKDVFEPHYWEKSTQPQEMTRQVSEVSLPPAMAEFAVENHRREETDSDDRPIVSQQCSTQPLRARPFTRMIKDIVLWRNVKDSAMVFSAGFMAMLALSYLSFISVIAYSSLAVLTLAGAIVLGRQIMFAVQKRSGPHPFRRHMEQDVVISPEFVHHQVDNLLYPINRSLTRMRNLYLADSLAETLKFMLYMYILTYIGSWFNMMTLLIIGWVAAFTLPKVYMMYRPQIDRVFVQVRGYVRKGWSTVEGKFNEQRDRIQNKRTEKQGQVTEKTTTVTKVQKVE